MHVLAGIQEGSRPYVQPQLDGGAVQVAGMLGDAVLLLCTGGAAVWEPAAALAASWSGALRALRAY